MKLCCLHQNGHQISSRYGHVLLLEDRIVVIRIKNYKKLKLFIIRGRLRWNTVLVIKVTKVMKVVKVTKVAVPQAPRVPRSPRT